MLTAPAPRWRAPPATAQWVTGVRCGQGVLRVPDGYVYSGEWRDDRKHGHGMATYKDGDTPETLTSRFFYAAYLFLQGTAWV
jgi:hypothetical protein